MLDGSRQQHQVALVCSGSTSLGRMGVSLPSSFILVEAANQTSSRLKHRSTRKLSTFSSPAHSSVAGKSKHRKKGPHAARRHSEQVVARLTDWVFPLPTMDFAFLEHVAHRFPVPLTSAPVSQSTSAVSNEQEASLMFLSGPG